ncbi:MAG: Stk1 family PASTA domain-containing Ser/Thr kinase, partial [Candidatus Nanopelagicales bacterium]|nr:Stk1 family PASTA domain-containing Ser/Thr kinase [Candidatus Nanopelagicales bacterium]
MATVYEALDTRLDRVVALKVMHPHLAEDPGFVSRFEREAKAAARLSHPHVVGVFDQGESDGLVYLAMEYIPGRTLRDVVREFGPLTTEQALVFLDPVLEALVAAHGAGFVHRDIKPENVLISDDGRVKVADFGLARAVSDAGSSATTGMIIGTVAYLSPEQVEHGDADGRSDIYSAGVLLYELITGSTPHSGESPLAIAYQHVNTDVPAPSGMKSDIPAEADALVVAATRRDPDLRYPTAAAFLADVRRVRAMLPAPRPFMDVRDTVVVDRATAASMAAAHSTPTWQRDVSYDENPTSRRRGPWVALVIALVVGLAAFGGWWLAAGPGKTVPTPDLLGLSTSQAQSALAAAGLTFELAEKVFSEEIPADVVVTTDPAPGDGVREAGSVAATISKGPERYQVPDVQGLTPEAATAAINAANLAAGGRVEGFSDDIPAGSVTGTDPKIGESLKPLTPVDLVISKGPKPVVIANVVGKRAPASKTTLESAGLVVTSSTKFSEKVADGRVISVSPAAGTKVDSGSSVALVISKGPPPVVIPNLVDLPRRKAVAALAAVGLKAQVEAGAFTPLNRVISQSPAAGQEIPKGSTVTIRII